MKLNQMMMMVEMDGNGGGEYGTDGKQPQVPQPKQLTVLFPERRSLKLSRAVHGDLRRLKLRHLTSFTLVKKSLLRSQMAKASRAKKDGTFFAGPGHGAGPIHQRNRWDREVWMILWITGWWFQPLWKIWKSVEMIIPNIWKNKKSKPPISFAIQVEFNLRHDLMDEVMRKQQTDRLKEISEGFPQFYRLLSLFGGYIRIFLYMCRCICYLYICIVTSN